MLAAIVIILKFKDVYEGKLFFSLHLFFVILLGGFAAYIYVADTEAGKSALKQAALLQEDICSGRQPAFSGWIKGDSGYYQLEYKVLGQGYRLRCYPQPNKGDYKLSAFRGYVMVPNGSIVAGPARCKESKEGRRR